MADEDNPFIRFIRQAAQDGHSVVHFNGQLRENRTQALIDQHTQEMQQRFETTVAQIPECVRCHFSEGRPYGRVMRLRFDESEEDPRWTTGFWDLRKPDPNKLLYAARQVYDFCLAHELNPYLERDYDFDVQKFFLYMGIDCRHHA
jgi:hypothetical protein